MIDTKEATTEPIIVCRDVHKWFGEFHALKGITTSVRRGEKVVVLGPSGSGKSTFIRTINRLDQHQRGDIIVDDIELTNDVRNIDAIRREVGMVFQSFNLFPHLTVMDNITLAPMKVRKWPRAQAEEAAIAFLERVGIPEQVRQVPRRALGRSAAAGGDRAGARHAAQDHAVRRADFGPRPRDDQGGSGRPARARHVRHDDDHRHPRSRLRQGSRRQGDHVRRGTR